MAASLLFSFVVGDDLVSQTKGLMKGLRGWWFALAFVCIGLETRLSTLVSMGRRPSGLRVSHSAGNERHLDADRGVDSLRRIVIPRPRSVVHNLGKSFLLADWFLRQTKYHR